MGEKGYGAYGAVGAIKALIFFEGSMCTYVHAMICFSLVPAYYIEQLKYLMLDPKNGPFI